MEHDDDPLSNALTSRRIPHGRMGKKGKGGGRSRGDGGDNIKPFDPLRALGRYELYIGSGGKKHRREAGNDPVHSAMWLEIHELTEGEDGLMGTFNFEHGGERISGICVLAGSRKRLGGIISNMDGAVDWEKAQVHEEEEENRTLKDEEGRGHPSNSSNDGDDAGDKDEDEEEGHGDDSTGDLPTEKLINRARAFEKNSFRNPKFWMRWKARQYHDQDKLRADDTETPRTTPVAVMDGDQAYLIFSGNGCERFEGSVRCAALGWNNAKLRGWKVRSRASRCPVSWSEI